MEITPSEVKITASAAHGLYNGLCSLIQLFPAEIECSREQPRRKWTLPCVKITDVPRFPYRGIMIDVARHFIPVNSLKRQIDIMASLKIKQILSGISPIFLSIFSETNPSVGLINRFHSRGGVDNPNA